MRTIAYNGNPFRNNILRLNTQKNFKNWIKMLTWQNKQGSSGYKYCRQFMLTAAVQIEHNQTYNQNMIATINHRLAIKIKFLKHSWLFRQLLKKLAVVKRLFWQLFGLSAGKKNGCCKQEAIVERWPLVEVRLYTYLRFLNIHLAVIFPHLKTGRGRVRGYTEG